MSYDRALTIFSPDGHLFQVEYAQQAVERGATVVGVSCPTAVVLAVEKKSVAKLQESRTMKKIAKIDNHIMVAFAGLNADARVLINRARIECQSFRLTVEDAPSVEYVSKWIAQLQQRYTQRGGVRPFGVTSIIAGFDPDGTPMLFQTEPTGAYSAWKAATCGKNTRLVREYLEKKYKDGMTADEAVGLAIEALLEVVDSGKGNIELVLLTPGENGSTVPKIHYYEEDKIEQIAKEVEKKKEEEAERKKREATQ